VVHLIAKKVPKNGYLDKNLKINKDGMKLIPLVISNLVNQMVSINRGVELAPASHRFVNKVLRAFHETILEHNSPMVAYEKLVCVELLGNAYKKHGPERSQAIETVIGFVEGWHLNSHPLGKANRQRLHQPAPQFGDGRKGGQALAIQRIPDLLESYSMAEFYRDKKRKSALFTDAFHFYGNHFNLLLVLNDLLQILFGAKLDMRKSIAAAIPDAAHWSQNKYPVNDGKSLSDNLRLLLDFPSRRSRKSKTRA
jgi:hypothetical protein